MDSKRRFILVYTVVAMAVFAVYAALNQDSLGVYVSSIAVAYFALRLTLNPSFRLRFDVLGLILLAFFVYFVTLRVAAILSIPL